MNPIGAFNRRATFSQGFWGVFILALALAAHARAADAGPPGYYTATVVDDQGRPVSGATVDSYYYIQSSGWFGYRDQEPEQTQHTVTDSNGVFVVLSSPGATLSVVKKAGLATAWKTWSDIIPDSSEPVVLSAPTSLAGTVLDESNQPVAGAEVWVTEATIGDGYGREVQENRLFDKPARDCFSALTAADGRFRIANFPAGGQAGLAAKMAGKAQRLVGSGFASSQQYRSGDEDIELGVGPSGAVEGKVIIEDTGQPLAGIKIELQPTQFGFYDYSYRGTIVSGADGTFRIPDVQPGEYSARASIPAQPVSDWVSTEFVPVKVAAGETARDVVLHASKGVLVEVSAVTTNEHAPVVGALVSTSGGYVYTGINGMAMCRAPAGNGKVYFSARKDWFLQQREVNIEPGHVNNVWIEMIPPPTISGAVRDSSGAPAAGALVSFHPGVYPDAPDYSEVTADKNGRYEISLKLSREDSAWEGFISPTNYILARDLARNRAAIQEFDKIPANLDLVLQPGITLSGSVQDTNGAPITNATVNIEVESGGWSSGQIRPPPVKVNAQGVFTIPAMPQGRRYSSFEGITAKGYGMAGAFLDTNNTMTNHYEFPPFVLKRADRKLAGQVLGVDGKPIVGANVNLSGQGQRQQASTPSGRNGQFRFEGVCEGQVAVQASYTTVQPPLPGAPGPAPGVPPIPRYTTVQGSVTAHGGDTNIIVKLGMSNGVSIIGPGGLGR
jgi:protocatechuate 3,4-dioxygenase beta subunit